MAPHKFKSQLATRNYPELTTSPKRRLLSSMKTTFIVETKTKTNINSKEYYYEKKKKEIHVMPVYTYIHNIYRHRNSNKKKRYRPEKAILFGL